MRIWVCVLALLAGGCESLLGLEHLDRADAGGSGGADAMRRGDAAPGLDATPRGDAAPDAQLLPGCPPTYTQITGTGLTGFYRFHPNPATWSAAETVCEAEGAAHAMHTHLAVFANDSETSGVQTSVVQNNTQAWIGLSSIGHTGFNWVTDENTMGYPMSGQSPWHSGYPVTGTSVDCVKLDGLAGFININCQTSLAYVCECDAYPADPANF